MLPSWVVDYVAAAPGGSHPSYALGYSARDNDYYQAWDAISRDRERFSRWLAEEVYGEAGSLAGPGPTGEDEGHERHRGGRAADEGPGGVSAPTR